MRDKLIELLKKDPCPSTMWCDPNCQYAHLQNCFAERYADHLLANGVIVPPVKINQTVYVIDKADIRHPIKEKIVLEIQFGYSGAVLVLQDTPLRLRRAYNFGDISKTVFLTREEAERVLRGNSNE